MNNIFLNVYTNGLDRSTCKVVLIEAIKTDSQLDITDHFKGIVKPSSDFVYNEELTVINGITKEEIELNGDKLQTVFDKFCDFSKDSTIIGHNITKLGIPILYINMRQENISPKTNLWKQPIIDLFNLSRTIPCVHSKVDLKKYYNLNTSTNSVNDILWLYKKISNDVTSNEIIANKLAPDGWLNYDGDKIRLSKGKFAGYALSSKSLAEMRDYKDFILSNCCPRTAHTLTHIDVLYSKLNTIKNN